MDYRICSWDAQQAQAYSAELSEILCDCVAGGASVSFMAGLSLQRAQAFWQAVVQGLAAGERHLLVALEGAEARDGVHTHERVLGTVQLVTAMPDNQPHRADLAKMLVHRRARRQGIAAALLSAAEQRARELGKTCIVLDTETGGDAERLYARAGWTQAGQIPDFALKPDGRLCSTTLFYKLLAV
ncbi:GNAT family N-acetyltransferase [Undibacterium sp. CY7W]|uniref:GNAT family N-acetyltransferase n=1 Tax=Undibacterium rugosum TaxID=2762291 RepID=A0A923KYB7_9BURK|nr:GNAT family N-acetyltransferase [Undibacterium rugosum]MBC3934280.1 GNAT family N-acetyltransferase [Undibacterium rugosum]